MFISWFALRTLHSPTPAYAGVTKGFIPNTLSLRGSAATAAIQFYLALLFTGSPRVLYTLAMTKKNYDLGPGGICLRRDSATG